MPIFNERIWLLFRDGLNNQSIIWQLIEVTCRARVNTIYSSMKIFKHT